MKTTKDAIPPFGATTSSAARFGCKKGIFGKYFMATVNDRLVCTHMHQTEPAALRCARQWQAFQERVARIRQNQRMSK